MGGEFARAVDFGEFFATGGEIDICKSKIGIFSIKIRGKKSTGD